MNNNNSLYYQPLKAQYNQVDAQQIQIVNYLAIVPTKLEGVYQPANFVTMRDQLSNKKYVYINKEFILELVSTSPEFEILQLQIDELFSEIDILQLEINDKVTIIADPNDSQNYIYVQNNNVRTLELFTPFDPSNYYDKTFMDAYFYDQQQINDQFNLDIGTLMTQMTTKLDKQTPVIDGKIYLYSIQNSTNSKFDIYNYFYDKTYIDTKFLDYYTITQANNQFYDQSYIDTLETNLQNQINDKVDTITDPNDSLDYFYKQTNNVRSLQLVSTIFNPSNYYDKTATDTLLNNKVNHLVGANPATTYYYSSLNGVDSLQPYSGGGGITIPYLLMSGSDIIFNLQTAFSRVGNGQVQTTWANSTEIQHYANRHIIYNQAGTTNYQLQFNGNNLDMIYGITSTTNLSFNPTLTSFKTILQVDNTANLRFFNTTTANSSTIMLIAGFLTILYGSTQNFFFTNTTFQSQLPVLINNNTSLTFGSTGASRARLTTTGASDYTLSTAVSSTYTDRYNYQHSGSSYGALNHKLTGQLQVTEPDIYFGTNGRIQSVSDEINILYDIGSLSFQLIYHYVRSLLTHYFYGTSVDFFSSSIYFTDTQFQMKKITAADRYISIPNYSWNSNQNSNLRITCADFTANTHQNFIQCNSISGDRNVEIMDTFQFNGQRISAITTNTTNSNTRGIEFPTYIQNGNTISDFLIGSNNSTTILPFLKFSAVNNPVNNMIYQYYNTQLQNGKGIGGTNSSTFISVGIAYINTFNTYSGTIITVNNRMNLNGSVNSTYQSIWKSYVWNGVNWENQGSYNTAYSLDCSTGIGTTRINIKQSSKIIKNVLEEKIPRLELLQPAIWQYKENTNFNLKKDDKIVGLCVEDIVDSDDKQVKQILGAQTLYQLDILQKYIGIKIQKIQIEHLFMLFDMKTKDYRGQYIQVEQDGIIYEYDGIQLDKEIVFNQNAKLGIQSYALDPDKYCQYLYTIIYQQQKQIDEQQKQIEQLFLMLQERKGSNEYIL